MVVRKHYFVSGSVQGVGFRYRAYHVANHLGLTGYVKNLYDGIVELEVQGEEVLLDSLLDRINEGTFIFIDRVESYRMKIDEQERNFVRG